MTTREHVACFEEQNNYLAEYPGGNQNSCFALDEVMDILEFGLPATWQKLFRLHDFNPVTHTMDEFVEFCERLEYAEVEPANANMKGRGQNDSKSHKNGVKEHAKSTGSGSNNNKKREAKKWCIYHETDLHDTGECKVILSQAKKMRGTWETARAAKKPYGTSNNKTWKRNDSSSDSNKKSKEEMHEIINKAVTRALKDSKKRKAEEPSGEQYNMEEKLEEDFDLLNIDEEVNEA